MTIDTIFNAFLFIFTMLYEFGINMLRRTPFGPRWFESDVKLDGKIALVTGANSGIGKETAIDFAKRGAKVILACRDEKRANDAVNEIKAQVPSANITFQKLDLASLKSVRKFVQNFKEPHLDLLINNAGVMMCPKWKTEDGFEMQFGTNHLGHFLLTLLLLPKLNQADHARIVNVSSMGHLLGQIYFDDINLDKNYSPTKAYGQSKLANILFTKELAKRLKSTNIHVYALHPGFVQTELDRHIRLKGAGAYIQSLMQKAFARSAKLGAQTTLYCALDKNIEADSGFYYDNCQIVNCMASSAKNDQTAKQLWELSARLVGVDAELKF